MNPKRALWSLIVVSTGLRLIWAASLGPGNDEAYHYLYTVHADWSYVDHPPMIAWVEHAGLLLAGGLSSTFGLRLGFVVLFAGSTWLMARLTSRFFSERAGVVAAFLLNVSAYYTAAAGAFALPDGPLVFFWLLTMNALADATREPGRLSSWVLVGLAWGGAMLSKYLAVFLPAGFLLFAVVEPGARPLLKRAGPHLAFVLGLLLFSPVLWWNYEHGWVSFAFQGRRAWGGLSFRPASLLEAIGGMALYLFPWIWAMLVVVLVRRGRSMFRDATWSDRFFLGQAIPPLALFLAVACTRRVLPHWTLVGVLPAYPLAGRCWEWVVDRPLGGRRLGVVVFLGLAPIALAVLTVVQARTGLLIPVANDPTADFFGWEQVADGLGRRGLLPASGRFTFCSRWYYAAHITFASRARSPILCYNPNRAQGFAYWSRPEAMVGRDGIFVGINDCSAEVRHYSRWFERVETLEPFPVLRNGSVVRWVRPYRFVRQTKPYPIGNAKPLSVDGSTQSTRSRVSVLRGFELVSRDIHD